MERDSCEDRVPCFCETMVFFFLFSFFGVLCLNGGLLCCRIRAEAGVMYVRVNMGRKRIDRRSRSALVSVL